jgi:hypothetical protein
LLIRQRHGFEVSAGRLSVTLRFVFAGYP